MDCLSGYIGIRGCSDSEPASGLYLDDLQGISIKSIDKIANAEQITYKGVFTDIERRALRRFESLITNWLSLKYQIKRVSQSGNLGLTIQGDATAAAADYRGYWVLLSELDDYVKSPLHVYHQQTHSLYLTQAQSATIKVFDVTGISSNSIELNQLDSTTFNGVVGWNTIQVNTDYKPTLGIAVVYDATNITSQGHEIPQGCYDYCGCLDDCYGCEAKVEGIRTNDLTPETVTRGTDTYGLSGIFSVGCKFDQFICDNRQAFATSLWFLYGHEYFNERLYSDRLNRYGILDREIAKEARDEMWKAFNEELQIILEGIDIKEDCCVSCNAQVKQMEAVL